MATKRQDEPRPAPQAEQPDTQVTMCTACAGMPVDQQPQGVGATDGTITKDGLLLCVTHAGQRDARLRDGGPVR